VTSAPPFSVWLLATHKLGCPIPLDEPYPHICGTSCGCHPKQRPISRRECGACNDR
jgi:hypothetical protein